MMLMETLIQNGPFHGQAINLTNGKVVNIEDFVGDFDVIEEVYDEESQTVQHKLWNKVSVSRVNPYTRMFGDTSNTTVLLHEYCEDECGIGAGCWLSSIAMMSWMKDNFEEFNGQRIMEIGAGVALPSLYLAKHKDNSHNFELYCTDYKHTIGCMLQENKVNNNLVNDDIQYHILDWKNLDDTIGTFDVVIACDCIYKSTSGIFKEAVLKHLKVGGKLLFINPLETSRPGVDNFIYSLAEKGSINIKHIAVRYNEQYMKPLVFVEFTLHHK